VTVEAGVAVVIPAYQAAATVGDVVRHVQVQGYPVLVVDDGSTDATASVAAKAGASVIRLARNRGKGAALRRGFERLLGDGRVAAVVTVDADGQHLAEEIPHLIAGWRAGADLVLGARDHLFEHMSRLRQISNRMSSRAISVAAGDAVDDAQTGFRLYTRRLIEAIGLPGDRFEAESVVVVRAARRGFRVVSRPVRLGEVDGRVTSHYRPLVDSLRIAVAVIGARFEHIDGRMT
jgi:glycosyltransferase involved in cell wall biosynthesis